jgi:hypothetical protein
MIFSFLLFLLIKFQDAVSVQDKCLRRLATLVTVQLCKLIFLYIVLSGIYEAVKRIYYNRQTHNFDFGKVCSDAYIFFKSDRDERIAEFQIVKYYESALLFPGFPSWQERGPRYG